jgi:phage shock protein C
MGSEIKRLYRSRYNRFIGGICGGFGDYFNIDANIIRVIFILLTFIGGVGIILYLVGLVILPENPSEDKSKKKEKLDQSLFWAFILIIAGVLILVKEIGFFHFFHFWHVPWTTVWAFILIILGVILIISSTKKNKKLDYDSKEIPFELYKITRNKNDRMIAGVCAGIAKYFNVDPAIIRLLWIFGTFVSVGVGVLIYIVLIFVLPEQEIQSESK